MKKIAVAGGGKIGIAIAELLGATGDYRVTVFDRDAEALERMPRRNSKPAGRYCRCRRFCRNSSKVTMSCCRQRLIH